MLDAGIHVFTRPVLEVYREAVVDPKLGPALVQAVEQVKASGSYGLGEEHYKKVPWGYDSEHRYADYMLYNGLTVAVESDVPDELLSTDAVEYCFQRFEDMYPIYRWLVHLMEEGNLS